MKDQPYCMIIPNALAAHKKVYTGIAGRLPPSLPGQSGVLLESCPHVEQYFDALTKTVSDFYDRPMYARIDKSSYRVQHPTTDGALALHQDYDALKELRYRRPLRNPIGALQRYRKDRSFNAAFPREPYVSEPDKEPCCTVWVPLTDIDEFTPTLEMSPLLPDGYQKHMPDAAKYSVIADQKQFADYPMLQITNLAAGWGILLTPLTLHRTCVRPWHIKVRHSLDLRFLPTPSERQKVYSWPKVVMSVHDRRVVEKIREMAR